MKSMGDLNGFIDSGCKIDGKIEFQDTLRVEGKVKGRIESKNDLIVGDKGEVEGEVEVGTLYVSGIVKGKVKALKKIVVHKGGKLYSDIETPAFVMEEGGIFEGSCNMSEKANQKESL